MGFNTVGQGNRTQRQLDSTQLGQGNQTQKPYMDKDHIWTKTIYGIPHSGTGKPDPKTIGFNTVGTGKPDPKTIYGIQHSRTRKPDPKIIGFNTVGTGKPDPKTIYGQRPYMDKDHIWDSTQLGQGNRTQ